MIITSDDRSSSTKDPSAITNTGSPDISTAKTDDLLSLTLPGASIEIDYSVARRRVSELIDDGKLGEVVAAEILDVLSQFPVQDLFSLEPSTVLRVDQGLYQAVLQEPLDSAPDLTSFKDISFGPSSSIQKTMASLRSEVYTSLNDVLFSLNDNSLALLGLTSQDVWVLQFETELVSNTRRESDLKFSGGSDANDPRYGSALSQGERPPGSLSTFLHKVLVNNHQNFRETILSNTPDYSAMPVNTQESLSSTIETSVAPSDYTVPSGGSRGGPTVTAPEREKTLANLKTPSI